MTNREAEGRRAMTTFKTYANGDLAGLPDDPAVYEGTRVVHVIKDERFPGTVTRVSARSVKVVYDDGLTVTATFKRGRGPSLPGPGEWEILPWAERAKR